MHRSNCTKGTKGKHHLRRTPGINGVFTNLFKTICIKFFLILSLFLYTHVHTHSHTYMLVSAIFAFCSVQGFYYIEVNRCTKFTRLKFEVGSRQPSVAPSFTHTHTHTQI